MRKPIAGLFLSNINTEFSDLAPGQKEIDELLKGDLKIWQDDSFANRDHGSQSYPSYLNIIHEQEHYRQVFSNHYSILIWLIYQARFQSVIELANHEHYVGEGCPVAILSQDCGLFRKICSIDTKYGDYTIKNEHLIKFLRHKSLFDEISCYTEILNFNDDRTNPLIEELSSTLQDSLNFFAFRRGIDLFFEVESDLPGGSTASSNTRFTFPQILEGSARLAERKYIRLSECTNVIEWERQYCRGDYGTAYFPLTRQFEEEDAGRCFLELCMSPSRFKQQDGKVRLKIEEFFPQLKSARIDLEKLPKNSSPQFVYDKISRIVAQKSSVELYANIFHNQVPLNYIWGLARHRFDYLEEVFPEIQDGDTGFNGFFGRMNRKISYNLILKEKGFVESLDYKRNDDLLSRTGENYAQRPLRGAI